MAAASPQRHASDSSEQRDAEAAIRAALERELGLGLNDDLEVGLRVLLDGFHDGEEPVCVEIWAHQGKAKGGQPAKVMKDMCKLLLVEKLLGRSCRKIFSVCDSQALAFLDKSWSGRFADEFDIELLIVEVPPDIRERVRQAQERQFR